MTPEPDHPAGAVVQLDDDRFPGRYPGSQASRACFSGGGHVGGWKIGEDGPRDLAPNVGRKSRHCLLNDRPACDCVVAVTACGFRPDPRAVDEVDVRSAPTGSRRPGGAGGEKQDQCSNRGRLSRSHPVHLSEPEAWMAFHPRSSAWRLWARSRPHRPGRSEDFVLRRAAAIRSDRRQGQVCAQGSTRRLLARN
jgi:hypothetical protein